MVIVGTDFSPTAARAVAKAQAIAERLGEPVEFVHIRQGPLIGPWQPDLAERDWLESVGVPASRITIRVGTPWIELIRIAEERGAAMIVLGTHGRSGFQTLALGTTAARLSLMSPRPTLLVGESLLRRTACVSAVPYDPPIQLKSDRREG